MAGFNIANFNLYSFAKRFWDMFGNPTPMDVEVPQKNPNGDIETYLCPNLAKFKKRVWDDVGGALGQFNRTFYVDAEGGNDSYEGSSSRPFRTLKKACDSVPVGGYGSIYLKTNITINAESEQIVLKNKVISLLRYNTNNLKLTINIGIVNDRYFANVFKFYGLSSVQFYKVDLETVDNADTSKTINYADSVIFKPNHDTAGGGLNIGFYNNSITLSSQIYSMVGSNHLNLAGSGFNNVSFYDSNITTNTAYVTNAYGTTVSLQVRDGAIDNDTHWVSSIVKDANGVPRNVISNIVF